MILYSKNSNDEWYRTVWAPQCPATVYFDYKCQGAEGHPGVHWCFGPAGNFLWNEANGPCGSTPPTHKSYRTPKSMTKLRFMAYYTTTKVKDAKVIAKLEKNKPPEKHAAIDRAITQQEFKNLSSKGHR